MRIRTIIAAILLSLAAAQGVLAQDESKAEKSSTDRGPKLGEPLVEKWKFGLIVTVSGGAARGLTGTTAVPMNWPEQSVKIVEQDLSPGVTIKYKSYGTAKQMVVVIPRVTPAADAHAILTLEVTRNTLLPPDNTEVYVLPEASKLPPEFKQYLSPSPLIESNHTRIRKIAKEIAAGQTKAWPHVRAIYDWVRKTIKYKENPNKSDTSKKLDSCLQAIDKGSGDCNQLTSAFIAICRASGIPARTVQIPDHCYPEFYLLDDKHEGHWFPAEASGGDEFGGILTHKPILQKGDAFRVTTPGKTETFRLLPSNLTSSSSRNVTGQPALRIVNKAVDEK
jgi:transglutaminase-like putative cysteine protease